MTCVRRISVFAFLLACLGSVCYAGTMKTIPVVNVSDCRFTGNVKYFIRHPYATLDINSTGNDTTLCWGGNGTYVADEIWFQCLDKDGIDFLLSNDSVAIVNMMDYQFSRKTQRNVLMAVTVKGGGKPEFLDLFHPDVKMSLKEAILYVYGSSWNFCEYYRSYMLEAFQSLALRYGYDVSKEKPVKKKLYAKRHSRRYFSKVDSVIIKGNMKITFYHDGSSPASHFGPKTDSIFGIPKDAPRHFIRNVPVLQFRPETFPILLERHADENLEDLSVYKCNDDSLYVCNYNGTVKEYDDIIMKINRQGDRFIAGSDGVTLLRMIEDDNSEVLHLFRYFARNVNGRYVFGELKSVGKTWDFISFVRRVYGSVGILRDRYIAIELARFKEILGYQEIPGVQSGYGVIIFS